MFQLAQTIVTCCQALLLHPPPRFCLLQHILTYPATSMGITNPKMAMCSARIHPNPQKLLPGIYLDHQSGRSYIQKTCIQLVLHIKKIANAKMIERIAKCTNKEGHRVRGEQLRHTDAQKLKGLSDVSFTWGR